MLKFDFCIVLVNTDLLSFVEKPKFDLLLLPNTNNQDEITTVSIGVGRSANNSARQDTVNETITDEYVSFIPMI